jgi:proline iminopeptidase
MNTPFLYPAIEPYSVQRLKVSAIHELYIEECGNPNGHPVIFIHGGPGGGVGPDDRRYFNPKDYRIILFDQRGAGKSTPAADLTDNTTWHLVEDIETIRVHLKIKKWLVFGGSWGSTLALTYAIQHPGAVVGLVLRGIFMIRKKEIDWFYQSGADAIFPDVWESYQNAIPEAERQDYVRAYYSRLTSPDLKIQMQAAKAWTTWEIATSRLYTPPELIAQTVTDDFAIKFARIECHYFIHRGFFKVDDWILKNVQNIKSIPMFIAQGRYDVVCPMTSAWDLHRALPAAELRIIADAGHSSREPGIARALTEATDRFIQYFR